MGGLTRDDRLETGVGNTSRCPTIMDQSADHWHTIRPWIHRFILSVNHVSSVSAAFTLEAALTAEPLDPALESLLEDEQDGSRCTSTDHADAFARSRTVSDALTRGLSVKVNSTPWQRVLLRVDEETDKAIVIVFGLTPGRQYDVELGIAHPQEALRSQITTDVDDHLANRTESSSNSNAHDRINANGSAVMSTAISNPDTTPSDVPKSLTADSTPSPSSSPSPTYSPALSVSDSGEVPSSASTPSITLEEKIQQLNQTLSVLQSERDSLAVSLKTTRRDAQRADAAIRADIETLKRTSDKFASVEHRARQKVLALQETVKQTLAAAEETTASVTDVESSLPILREQQAEAERECKVARQQATRAREEREALERHEKKQIDSLQTELAGLGSKLEKLNSKREKLENSVIPELEEELRRIEEEIAAATGSSPPATDHSDPCQPGSSSALPSLSEFPDDLHSTAQDSFPGPTENSRRKKSQSHPPSTSKHQQPQTQKPIQILRSPHQQVRPALISSKSTATSNTSTSTLSSLAAPFEPSPKRQARLQSTLGTPLNSSSIASALKVELNPTSSVFAPRMGLATSSTSSTSISTSTSHKSTGASPTNSTPRQSAWLRGNQKSRRSDVE
ncbi:hypothetical protein BJ322DRAFT_1106623 [Thelephora terrestris]|uniref:Uncharacterized protein n=1 Tax=Thelephora terrestris TaxID=56493 RepID=A0A9P6HJY8_9AGAM|nr:hypothetical protein BJ322DRAFT_1106623 [Thelephora terrestris]